MIKNRMQNLTCGETESPSKFLSCVSFDGKSVYVGVHACKSNYVHVRVEEGYKEF